MVYVRRLKERQNVIKMFRVTHTHGFFVLEAPEPKCACSQVVAEKHTLLCVIIVSSIGDVISEGVRPQFVELFPNSMTAGVGPVGISATPMK
jgi:hypothetical protein